MTFCCPRCDKVYEDDCQVDDCMCGYPISRMTLREEIQMSQYLIQADATAKARIQCIQLVTKAAVSLASPSTTPAIVDNLLDNLKREIENLQFNNRKLYEMKIDKENVEAAARKGFESK